MKKFSFFHMSRLNLPKNFLMGTIYMFEYLDPISHLQNSYKSKHKDAQVCSPQNL